MSVIEARIAFIIQAMKAARPGCRAAVAVEDFPGVAENYRAKILKADPTLTVTLAGREPSLPGVFFLHVTSKASDAKAGGVPQASTEGPDQERQVPN